MAGRQGSNWQYHSGSGSHSETDSSNRLTHRIRYRPGVESQTHGRIAPAIRRTYLNARESARKQLATVRVRVWPIMRVVNTTPTGYRLLEQQKPRLAGGVGAKRVGASYIDARRRDRPMPISATAMIKRIRAVGLRVGMLVAPPSNAPLIVTVFERIPAFHGSQCALGDAMGT